MRVSRRACALLSAAVLVVALACSDATTRPRLQSPLVGTWELTTHFDTFSFETGAPSPPDCPVAPPGTSQFPYCTHYRTTTAGASLGGLLELKDTTSTSDMLSNTVYAAGTLQMSFCDSIDYQGLTGCAHVSDRAAIKYSR
jgi:hypothetical protein